MKSVRELLTGKPPISLPGSATVFAAAEKMVSERVGAMLVSDASGATLGIFTERDLMIRVVVPGRDPTSVQLAEVMTKDLFTVSPERRVNEVWREMHERHVRHLPVVENGRCIGILGLRDLLSEHLSAKRAEVQALTAYIQGEGEGPQ